MGNWTAILGADVLTFFLEEFLCTSPCWGILDPFDLLDLLSGNIFGETVEQGPSQAVAFVLELNNPLF
jgi:hypothetical protein